MDFSNFTLISYLILMSVKQDGINDNFFVSLVCQSSAPLVNTLSSRYILLAVTQIKEILWLAHTILAGVQNKVHAFLDNINPSIGLEEPGMDTVSLRFTGLSSPIFLTYWHELHNKQAFSQEQFPIVRKIKVAISVFDIFKASILNKWD